MLLLTNRIKPMIFILSVLCDETCARIQTVTNFRSVCKEVPFQIFRPMVKELATIMVQEAIKLHYAFQWSEQKQQKSPSGSKAHLALTNYPLTGGGVIEEGPERSGVCILRTSCFLQRNT